LKSLSLLIVLCLCLSVSTSAQLVDEFDIQPSGCCLAMQAKRLADQLQDWNQLGRYHHANQELKKAPTDPSRVVFMGDSITDGWKLEDYFPGKPYVNRGIGGQTTSQMLARMYADVIELKPKVMVLLAGTNDIARNTGPVTAEMIQHNVMAMTVLAQHHGIKVILCSILPVSDYPYERQQREIASNTRSSSSSGRPPASRPRVTTGRPPADILKLNAWIKDYANKVDAIYVDYFAATVDQKGMLTEAYSEDGLHPNAAGYKVMAPVVEAAIQQALQQ
jgi:lysophospholipase L1-like esterase